MLFSNVCARTPGPRSANVFRGRGPVVEDLKIGRTTRHPHRCDLYACGTGECIVVGYRAEAR